MEKSKMNFSIPLDQLDIKRKKPKPVSFRGGSRSMISPPKTSGSSALRQSSSGHSVLSSEYNPIPDTDRNLYV